MASITIKNIPDDLLSKLKKRAKNSHRSLNGEIIMALMGYLNKDSRPDPQEIIHMARQFRAKVKGTLTEEEIRAAINEGRP
jgi:plasmid stability protein